MEYAMHEVLELQEMAAFKTICLTKSKTMRALVTDQKLRDIMQLDCDTSTQQLQAYSNILSKAMNQEK